MNIPKALETLLAGRDLAGFKAERAHIEQMLAGKAAPAGAQMAKADTAARKG